MQAFFSSDILANFPQILGATALVLGAIIGLIAWASIRQINHLEQQRSQLENQKFELAQQLEQVRSELRGLQLWAGR